MEFFDILIFYRKIYPFETQRKTYLSRNFSNGLLKNGQQIYNILALTVTVNKETV